MNYQKPSLLGNSRGIASWKTHAIASPGESGEGLGWLYLWARSTKRGTSSQSSKSKVIGLRMGRDLADVPWSEGKALSSVNQAFPGNQAFGS